MRPGKGFVWLLLIAGGAVVLVRWLMGRGAPGVETAPGRAGTSGTGEFSEGRAGPDPDDPVHAPGHRHRGPPPDRPVARDADVPAPHDQPWVRSTQSDSQVRRGRGYRQ